jgi:hypothetical protein
MPELLQWRLNHCCYNSRYDSTRHVERHAALTHIMRDRTLLLCSFIYLDCCCYCCRLGPAAAAAVGLADAEVLQARIFRLLLCCCWIFHRHEVRACYAMCYNDVLVRMLLLLLLQQRL